MFAKGCSAPGCPLVIPLNTPLSKALQQFYEHNAGEHDELSPQHLVYLYVETPTDPTLGTEGEDVVK